MSAYIRVASAVPPVVNVPQYFQQSIVSPSQSNIYYMEGNMGLGQAVPGSKLVVDGNCSIGFPTTPAPSNGLIVSGSVGVGTSTPIAKLHLNGNIRVETGAENAFSNGNTYFFQQTLAGNKVRLGGYDTVMGLMPLDFNGETLNITGTGRVGIGKTNPATALDVNGTIKNLNPAFSASRTAGNQFGTGTIVFNAVYSNVGSHFNSANGRFTAPVSGHYLFSIFAMMNGNGQFWIQLRKNGSPVNNFNPLQSLTTGVIWNAVSGTTIVALNAGDYVEPYLAGVEASYLYGEGNAHNQFCGCLLG